MIQISIIVPLFRGKCYVMPMIEQVQKAANNIDEDVELLFVNDDPNEKISINEIRDNLVIRTKETGENRGIHGTRVYGYQESEGQFVVFLDQDDKIAPNYLYSQRAAIADADADAVVCQGKINNDLIYKSFELMKKNVSKEKVMSERNYIISPGQVLIKREEIPELWLKRIIKNNGADDWFLWLCMYNKDKKIALNYDQIFYHVLHDSNTSLNVIKMYASVVEVVSEVIESKEFPQIDIYNIKNAQEKMRVDLENICSRQQKVERLYNRWLQLHFENISIGKFVRDRGNVSIAIYGAGEIGIYIFRELQKEQIDVDYFIDRNKKGTIMGKNIYFPNDSLPHVDLGIVSLIQNESDIIKDLKREVCQEVYSINQIIENLLENNLG